MENKEIKKETCRMCGKKLPAEDMFKKIEIADRRGYLCCQVCYEQFSGRRLSSDSEMEYQ